MSIALAASGKSGGLWFRVHARVRTAQSMEAFLAPSGADSRVVEFARQDGEFPTLSATEPYYPLLDRHVLGQFIATFGPAAAPADEDIEEFYRRFGAVRNTEWMERLAQEDREQLPQLTRLALREPLWWIQEMAAELERCCELYQGLRDDDAELIRGVLTRLPADGVLGDIFLLAGELKKIWASPEQATQRVGSVGEWEESPEHPGRPATAEESVHWARRILRRQLNRYEARTHRQWLDRAEVPMDDLRPDDRLLQAEENPILGGFRTIAFDCLITALYAQLSDLVEREGLLRRCRGCGCFFSPTRPDRQFCTVKCADAYRRRQFNRRQRETKKQLGEAQDAGR